jgi:DNA-binding NarL/FixJ family response regulator
MTALPPLLRILIADDHDVMLEGARTVIERQPGWEVCGTVRNGREAVAWSLELKPDVVILDMTMPELNGLDAARQIRRRLPQTEILMYSGHQTEELVREVFEAGAKAFIAKSEAHTHLVAAVESLSRHKPFFTNDVSEILFSRMVNRAEGLDENVAPGERLTAREREVMQLLAEGRSNREVSETLGISVRTTEAHRAHILQKLKLDSVAGLVRYAIRNNLIEA